MAKETCIHCGRRSSVIANRLISIEDELVFIHKLLEKKPIRHSKCVCSLGRSNRKRIRKALQFTDAKRTKVNALDGSPLNHPDYVDDAYDSSSSILPDQVDDASCKTFPLTDHVHVHNDDGPFSLLSDQCDDGPSSLLSDQYDDGPYSLLSDQCDDASCKTLPGEVADFVVDSEDRSLDERITDVLAQIHGEDDIKEFGDAA
ncbi:hypothetical protein K7X08_000428 [Anisodus acutangulus]|uniref:Uncharacterized protein n=1 Tax=Anisodus acutangulus TaxID=402998 RepID=A0A9Q1M4B6_9SOLA|nr:hypothetical protein K7X08_000428 [Anisodus acutangulus]